MVWLSVRSTLLSLEHAMSGVESEIEDINVVFRRADSPTDDPSIAGVHRCVYPSVGVGVFIESRECRRNDDVLPLSSNGG